MSYLKNGITIYSNARTELTDPRSTETNGNTPGALLGEEGERAEEEEHEEHASVLEVDEAGLRRDASAAGGEDAATELQAHVEERAAGHHVTPTPATGPPPGTASPAARGR